MANIDDSIIGKVMGHVKFPIEAGKIQEFARSLHFDDPVFYDEDAAKKAGFPAIPAPPTYSVVSAHFPSEGDENFIDALGLDLKRILHGEQTWTYHRTPVAGDVLSGETKVKSVSKKPGKRGGEMTFVIMETVLKDQKGQPVVTTESTIIETAQTVGA